VKATRVTESDAELRSLRVDSCNPLATPLVASVVMRESITVTAAELLMGEYPVNTIPCASVVQITWALTLRIVN
jgi:hypothetical protein